MPTPAVGRPLFSIYSFEFAGLDPNDGAPLGILDGEPSREYAAIYAEATPENIQFHGAGRPTQFGSFRNTLGYKGFSLSANITYRLGYFVKRAGVDYVDINRGGFGHADYERRWRQPGDERTTEVPADPGTVNPLMNGFYLSSGALVEKGDHIRFQDIRLAYSWNAQKSSLLGLNGLETYLYINNLGILWKEGLLLIACPGVKGTWIKLFSFISPVYGLATPGLFLKLGHNTYLLMISSTTRTTHT